MSTRGQSNASVRVTPEILFRLIACVLIAFGFAWIGGQLTGMDMWTFMDTYTWPFYFGVALLGMAVTNPALRKQRQSPGKE